MLLSTAPFVGAPPLQASRAAIPRRVLRCRAEAAQHGALLVAQYPFVQAQVGREGKRV